MMMIDQPQPLLTIITVAKEITSPGFRDTADSLAPLLTNHSTIEWLVVPGAEHRGDGPPPLWYGHGQVLPVQSDGIYAAMNAGLDHAQGQYVWFLNGGDTLTSLKTGQNMLQCLRLQQPDFLYADSVELGLNGTDWYKPSQPHHRCQYGMFTHHQAMIYRRAVIGDERYATRFEIAADYAFTLKHLQQAKRVTHLPEALCRFQPGGLSTQQAARGRREQRAIRRALLGTPWMVDQSISLRQGLSQQCRRWAPGVWSRLRQRAGHQTSLR